LTILACRGTLVPQHAGWLLLAAAPGWLAAGDRRAVGLARGPAASLRRDGRRQLVVFAAAVVLNAAALRLAALVGSYVLLLILLGWLASVFEVEPPLPAAPGAWFAGHVLLAIAAYAALTLCPGRLRCAAGVSAFKHGWTAGRSRPAALAETERCRMPSRNWPPSAPPGSNGRREHLTAGQALVFSHKILLSFAGFGSFLSLLILHHRTGPRAQGGALAAQRLSAADLARGSNSSAKS
jgi:hypothetical protein